MCYNIYRSDKYRAKCWCGSMAEQLICNQQVDGSTPFTSSSGFAKRNRNMGDFPSGQRGQTVNLLSLTSVVRIHHPPPKKHLLLQVLFLSKITSRPPILPKPNSCTPWDSYPYTCETPERSDGSRKNSERRRSY